MSADEMTEPIQLTQPTESNGSKKRKSKAQNATKDTASPPVEPSAENAAPAMDGESNESPYIKDLQKQIRSVNKKLNAMTKLDQIIADHPDLSLDDLLNTKKINADQKAQALKKPALQTSLTQLEEQITQYKKIDADYQTRMSTERESLTGSHKKELEELRASLKQEAEEEAKTNLRRKLLTFTQFLRAAAAQRIKEEEADTEESKAFEGALLLVYGGDDKAVEAAENLIEGKDEAVPSVEGLPLSVTFAKVRELAVAAGSPAEDGFNDAVQESATMTQTAVEDYQQAASQDPLSDPTIAHAGLTELGVKTNGLPEVNGDDLKSPPQMSAGDESANKVGGTTWDNAGAEAGLQEAEPDYEIVPRPAEETIAAHEPASQGQTNSWADDAAAEMPVRAADTPATTNGTPAAADDGFQEVASRRGGRGGHRGDGEGRGRGGRGRGGRGGERGRGGFRGERRGGGEGGRGRGRGAPRGA